MADDAAAGQEDWKRLPHDRANALSFHGLCSQFEKAMSSQTRRRDPGLLLPPELREHLKVGRGGQANSSFNMSRRGDAG